MDNKPKRIGIDARFYGPVGKGLGRYTQEVIDNIIKLDRENEYVIFLRRENFSDFQTNSPRVKKVLADVKWYTLAEQILLPCYIWREHLALMHFPHFNVPIFCPTKFVVTIHDLILIKFPTWRATTLGSCFYKIKNFVYKIVIFIAAKRARKVLAVSEYTKNDIIKQFKINPEKVIVTYEGVADLANAHQQGEVEASAVLDKYNIKRPYLLYVGNAYPHKNLEGLIKVYAQINKEMKDLKLILVGKEDYFYHRLKQSAKIFFAIGESQPKADQPLAGAKSSGGHMIFPGYVLDGDLKILYAKALAYVFPSFYEGFGLPPLEAMAHGLPVVSSNKTCLPEVLGDAAIYFNPANEQEMKEKIELVIKNENLRYDLIKRGLKQVKKYSWRDCAEKTLEVYKKVLK
jgi:glycosyltransferase involved in cell wall biosynthesis